MNCFLSDASVIPDCCVIVLLRYDKSLKGYYSGHYANGLLLM